MARRDRPRRRREPRHLRGPGGASNSRIPDRPIDLCTPSGARATRRGGYTDAEIARILGDLPPIGVASDEAVAIVAEQQEARPEPEGPLFGDP